MSDIRERVSEFSVKNFCLCAKNFRRGSLQCVTNSGYRKILCLRGLSRFFVENFSCRITEILSRGTLLCFTNFLVSKNVWKRGGEGGREGGREGVSRFSVEFFFVTSAEKFCRGIL